MELSSRTGFLSFFFFFRSSHFYFLLETRRGNRVLPIPRVPSKLVQPFCESRRLANGYCRVLGQTETPTSFESNCSISPFRWRDLNFPSRIFATRGNYHPCLNYPPSLPKLVLKRSYLYIIDLNFYTIR